MNLLRATGRRPRDRQASAAGGYGKKRAISLTSGSAASCYYLVAIEWGAKPRVRKGRFS